jgi:hypothetical protein
MYVLVFASSGVSGGLGPKSTCFFACSIARSPLNAVAIAEGAGLCELTETLGREVADGNSFRGQPPNNKGSAPKNPIAIARLASHVILLLRIVEYLSN